jgi:hypothetical protein
VRGDHADLGPQLAHALERRPLVPRIGVRVQQADRDRLDAGRPEVVEDRGQAREVERLPLGARRREPPRQLAPQVARHERLGLLVEQVEEVRPVAARDLERVAEPLGRDQPGGHALALGQRVDHDRGAVDEEADAGRIDAGARDHVEHPALEVRRRRVRLGGDDLLAAGLRIRAQVDEVGEGAADVGGDAVAHRRLSNWSTATASRISTPCTSCW